jgi:hypothetical protein
VAKSGEVRKAEECSWFGDGGFGDDRSREERSDDEAVRWRGESVAGGFEVMAAMAVSSTDVPEDGDRGPEERQESQNRDGDESAHMPWVRITNRRGRTCASDGCQLVWFPHEVEVPDEGKDA